MSEDNTPRFSLPQAGERSVAFPVLLATFFTALIVSSFLFFGEILVLDGAMGMIAFGCANLFLALPFTLLTILLYRRAKLPAQLELLAAILAGIAGTSLANWLLF